MRILLGPKMIVRAFHILREQGVGSLMLILWGHLCYRRIGLYVVDLDMEGIGSVVTKWPIDLGQLEEDDIKDYVTLHAGVKISDVKNRLEAGQYCFTARHQGRLIYSCWVTRNPVWIDFVSHEMRFKEDEAYFYESFTADDFRNGNVATACNAYLQEQLKARGLRRLRAVVLYRNTPGIRAIIKAGYRRVGTLHTIWLYRWRFNWGDK